MSSVPAARRLHPAARVAIVVVAGFVLLNVALRLLDSSTRGADQTAPRSSSFSTGKTGVAAWSELLRRNGHRVDETRGDFSVSAVEASGTLVVLDPDEVSDEEQRVVRAFVDDGGRLVVGGETSAGILDELFEEPPRWSPEGATEAEPQHDAPEVGALARVVTAGEGSWDDTGDLQAVLGQGDRAVMAVGDVGAGRVVALADPSPLQNRLLDRADNAALALQVVGVGHAVAFAEGQHGYGDAGGLGAIPDRWKVALVGLLAAALLGAVASGRRVGPPEDEARELPPPRRAYVDAVAETLARTRRPAEALAPLQQSARRELARRAGLAPGAGDDDLREAAARMGWSAPELAALFEPLRTDELALRAGRVLAQLKQGGDL